jgi:hypothetical protein
LIMRAYRPHGRDTARSCAKNCLEFGERLGEPSLCCESAQLVDDPVLGEDISLGEPIMLAFAGHVHGFVALDRPLRGVECPKPQPRVHLAFHQSMILLRHMIHILAWSEKAGLREGSIWLEGVESPSRALPHLGRSRHSGGTNGRRAASHRLQHAAI